MFRSNQLLHQSNKAIDLFNLGVRGSSVKTNELISLSSDLTGGQHTQLDAHEWLPLCSDVYQISPNLEDYLVVPVMAVMTNIPNTNGDCISAEELIRFNANAGVPFYKTFKGKPVHYEHDNKDYTKAVGVILDSYVSPLTGFAGNRAKMVLLLAIDRTKYHKLADMVLSGEFNTYSIGTKFKVYECSISKKIFYNNKSSSVWTKPGVPTYMNDQGQLVFRRLMYLEGFECSIVKVPSFANAVSNDIMVMNGLY